MKAVCECKQNFRQQRSNGTLVHETRYRKSPTINSIPSLDTGYIQNLPEVLMDYHAPET
jgi:hypothetical protein